MDMKALRERAGLRTVDVAYHLNVAESTVRNWDSGRTVPTLKPKQMALLCKLYEVSLEELAWAAEGQENEE